MSRQTDIAWAAGLFEGEGCLTVRKQPRRTSRHVQARLGSTDLDVVERFAAIVGVGRVYERRNPNAPPHHKPMHEWAVQDATGVRDVIDLLRPFLGERRLAKAEEVYAATLLIRPYGEHVTRCPQGHRYDDENTIAEEYIRDGKLRAARRCRTCHAARRRARREQLADTMREVIGT